MERNNDPGALTPFCALAVCTVGSPTTQTLSEPFVAQPVTVPDCLWVNLEITPGPEVCATAEMTGAAVTVGVSGQTLTFNGGAGPVTITVPPGLVTFSNVNGTVPTTFYDGTTWQTVVAACNDTEVGDGPSADSLLAPALLRHLLRLSKRHEMPQPTWQWSRLPRLAWHAVPAVRCLMADACLL